MYKEILLLSIIISLCIVLLEAVFILTFLKIIDYKNLKNKNIDLQRYEINTRSQELNMSDILDKFIAECFTDYVVMVIGPKNEMYISDEREQEILSDVSSKVAERISPNLLERLSLYYNIDSIDKVIADKISIAVSSYIIEYNSVINTPIPNNKK